MTQILPYLEQRNAYAHIDRSVGVYHANNKPVRRLSLTVLNCPSGRFVAGYTSYAGLHHDTEAPIDTTNNGVFFLNSRLRYDQISDGTGQTIFIGEKISLLGDLGWMSGTRASLRNTGSISGLPNTTLLVTQPPPGLDDSADSEAAMMPGMPGAGAAAGTEPAAGSPTDGRDGNKTPPGDATKPAPNPPPTSPDVTVAASAKEATPASQKNPDSDSTDKAGAGSAAAIQKGALVVGGFGRFHPGGSNFAFGDGSLRYISSSINTQVFQQLGHRADGKLLSEDSF